ncbi:MAG: hypothetical protein Q9162_002163 [Coniocarpon cinnabarinum]
MAPAVSTNMTRVTTVTSPVFESTRAQITEFKCRSRDWSPHRMRHPEIRSIAARGGILSLPAPPPVPLRPFQWSAHLSMQFLTLRALSRTRKVALPPWRAPKLCNGALRPAFKLPAYSTSAAELTFGQPLHETHPHLLEAGELTPGITAFEYAERRTKLAQAMPAGSVAIVAASDIKTRSGAVFYKFHQDPSFFYLTGFTEPEAIAVIHKDISGNDHTFHLYVRPKDPIKEAWEGSRSGAQAAQDVFNADESGDINFAHDRLLDIVRSASHVFVDLPVESQQRSTFSRIALGSNLSKWQRFNEILDSGRPKPLRPYLHQLRAFKSHGEIANLRKAGQASGRGFTQAMSRVWASELDLEGFLEYQFKKNGCEASAYVPVIAGGENANQIHYVRNDAKLSEGMMVCADAGGEYGGYVADITRTWPINGKFTAAQKDLYMTILDVQRTCVALCRANANMSLDKLHGVADAALRQGLVELGFDLSKGAMDILFPHHLGHYIGLDIHDCPGYPRSGNLKSGQCITVEPGIYVDHNERWPEHFRGMGIRIEDSVCVQDEHPLVLSTEAVKEVVDIEALRP